MSKTKQQILEEMWEMFKKECWQKDQFGKIHCIMCGSEYPAHSKQCPIVTSIREIQELEAKS